MQARRSVLSPAHYRAHTPPVPPVLHFGVRRVSLSGSLQGGLPMETAPALSALAAGIMCMSSIAQAAEPLPRAKPEEVGMSSERLALIGKAVNAEIASGQLPGAVLAIARRGKLVYFETFGYRTRRPAAPMPSDAIFNIPWMTKPMVAVGALHLYEKGKLLMDEPLAKYFPRFATMQVAVMDPKKESIVETVPA